MQISAALAFHGLRELFSRHAAIRADSANPDIVVNNAGITRDGLFRKMSVEDWRAVIDTNLNSMFNVTRQVIDGMLEKGWGRIINISSVNGQKG